VLLLTVLAALLGLGAGAAVNRAAGAFPWDRARRSWWGGTSDTDGVPPLQLHDRGEEAAVVQVERPRSYAVRPPVVEVGTALLCALAACGSGPPGNCRHTSSWRSPERC